MFDTLHSKFDTFHMKCTIHSMKCSIHNMKCSIHYIKCTIQKYLKILKTEPLNVIFYSFFTLKSTIIG